ncbi:MAG: class I SAM-dependent methyltransferase [Spirochaetota bacterium]
MRLSKIEFFVMNNPVRKFMQKHLEFRIFKQLLKKHKINLIGKVILDAGCGSGYSSELLLKEFRPSQLTAFDFMPEQIDLAKKRGLSVDFFVGDVTKIELPDNAFDAVFIFGVLHHVPEWRNALYEVARVLKQKGVLLIEEPNKHGVALFDRLGFIHPKESQFNWPEFEDGLKMAGFEVLEKKNILTEKFKSFLCMNIVPTAYNAILLI